MIVKNLGKYIRHFGDVRLIQGTNKLDETETILFKEALKHPLNKVLVDKSEIEFEEKTESISDMSAKDAEKAIKDTFDLNLLDEFKEDEEGGKKRATVIKAIDLQIESIENPDEDTIVDPDE